MCTPCVFLRSSDAYEHKEIDQPYIFLLSAKNRSLIHRRGKGSEGSGTHTEDIKKHDLPKKILGEHQGFYENVKLGTSTTGLKIKETLWKETEAVELAVTQNLGNMGKSKSPGKETVEITWTGD